MIDRKYRIDTPPEEGLINAPWSDFEWYPLQTEKSNNTEGELTVATPTYLMTGKELSGWVGGEEMADESILDQEALPGDDKGTAEAQADEAAPVEEAPAAEGPEVPPEAVEDEAEEAATAEPMPSIPEAAAPSTSEPAPVVSDNIAVPVPKPMVEAAKKAHRAPRAHRVAATKPKLAKKKFKPVSQKHPGAAALASAYMKAGPAKQTKKGVAQVWVKNADKSRYSEVTLKSGKKHFIRIGSTFDVGGETVTVGPAVARRADGMLEIQYPVTYRGKTVTAGELIDERKICARLLLGHARRHGVLAHPGSGHGLASGLVEIGFFGDIWRGLKKAARGVAHAATSAARVATKVAKGVAPHLLTAAKVAFKATPVGQGIATAQAAANFAKNPSLSSLAAIHPALQEKTAQAYQLGKTLQGFQKLKHVPVLGQALMNNPIGKKLEAMSQLNKLAMSVPGVSTFAKKFVPSVSELEEAARLTQGGLSLKGAAAALQSVAPGSSAATMALKGAQLAAKAEEVSDKARQLGVDVPEIPGTSGFAGVGAEPHPAVPGSGHPALQAAAAFEHAAKLGNVIAPGHGLALAKAALMARPGSAAQMALLESVAPSLAAIPGAVARAGAKTHALTARSVRLLSADLPALAHHQQVSGAEEVGDLFSPLASLFTRAATSAASSLAAPSRGDGGGGGGQGVVRLFGTHKLSPAERKARVREILRLTTGPGIIGKYVKTPWGLIAYVAGKFYKKLSTGAVIPYEVSGEEVGAAPPDRYGMRVIDTSWGDVSVPPQFMVRAAGALPDVAKMAAAALAQAPKVFHLKGRLDLLKRLREMNKAGRMAWLGRVRAKGYHRVTGWNLITGGGPKEINFAKYASPFAKSKLTKFKPWKGLFAMQRA